MNKKILLGLFATSAMMLGTSCSSDDLFEQGGGNTATVSFALSAESGAVSRADIGEGKMAKELIYAIFDARGNLLRSLSDVDGTEYDDLLSGHVLKVKLAKNQLYTIALWAQSKDVYSPVIDDNTTFTVPVNYTDVANNAENRDAFFKAHTFTVRGDESIQLELTRPFAQINVGAIDSDFAEDAGFVAKQSTVTIKQAATQLNVITGNTIGDPVDVTYVSADIPQETLFVDGEEYNWLSMCYVLPAADPEDGTKSTTVSANFAFFNEGATKVVKLEKGLENTPIQRNYRTNIVGNILVDNTHFTVKIDKEFKTPAFSIWDGRESVQPELQDQKWIVNNPAQWAWLAENGVGENGIVLGNDLNFGNMEVPSLDITDITSFDGQGHTISNVVVAVDPNSDSNGLFTSDNLESGPYDFKNFNISNIRLNMGAGYAETATGGAMGAMIGMLPNGTSARFSNVNVKGANIKGIQAVGGLVGCVAEGASLSMSDCSVSNSYLGNYQIDGLSGYVAGLVGMVSGSLTFGDNVSISGTNIEAFFGPETGLASIDEIAAIYTNRGTAVGSITNKSGVSTSNNTVTPMRDATHEIKTAAELLAFANSFTARASEGDSAFAGERYVLGADIDLAGINWIPMGQHKTNGARFAGQFDGRGYTIKNMTIELGDSYFDSEAAGLFGWVTTGVIKNVKFVNANIKAHKHVGVAVGYLQNGKIDNVTVEGYTFEYRRASEAVGGIVGYVDPEGSAKVENCNVKNANIKASYRVGAIAGYGSATNFGKCTVNNVKFIVTDGHSQSGGQFGGYVGGYNKNQIYEINSVYEFEVFYKGANARWRNYQDKTVTLKADIDLGGLYFSPISQNGNIMSFRGTFDGNGKTIKNLYIDKVSELEYSYAYGLFGTTKGTIKNLTIDGAIVKSNTTAGVILGYSDGAEVENCHVKNAVIESYHVGEGHCGGNVGAVVGSASFNSNITGCSATNCEVRGVYNVGQVIGRVNWKKHSNITATNVTVEHINNPECPYNGSRVRNEIIGYEEGRN